jgi:Mg-chelatase subunit ChlD
MNFQAYTIPSHSEWACIHLHAPITEHRTPIHLVCIIDTSASMQENNKLVNVKHSLQFLLNFLTPQDRISIITFSDKVKTILRQEFTTLDEKSHIQTRISFITHESTTNLSSGIIESHFSLLSDTSSIKQGILLLTDGHANMGIVHPEDIANIARKTLTKFNGTSMSCIGYGTDHNVRLLQQISTDGGGAYYVVNNLDDVATVFGDILGGLVSCSYQQISVSFPKNTVLQTKYSIQNSLETTDVNIGDLPSGMDAIFLAKIPTYHPIFLKAYDLKQHAFITMEIQVKLTDDIELINNATAHYIRFEVISIINEVLEFNKKSKVSESLQDKIKLKQKINQYLKEILPNYSVSHPHSLWEILIKELEYCKYYLENKSDCCEDWAALMSQHSQCLGLMKGISSGSSQSQDVIPGGLPGYLAPTVSNHFSSPLQRQFSNELQQTVLSQSTIMFHNAVRIDTQEDMDDEQKSNSVLLPSLFASSSVSSSSLFSGYNFQLPPLPPQLPLLSSIASGSYYALPSSFPKSS